MKLQYKISLIMMLISLVILTSISYVYSEWSYNSVVENEKSKLTTSAIDSARQIELELLDKLSNAKTLASAPIVIESLQKSNLEYKSLSDDKKKEKISQLNKRWMLSKDAEDIFVKPYMNNELALYLKKQQSVLKGIYGELFITNLHGAMIATTGKLTTLAHSQKYWWKESYANGNGKVFFDDRGFDKSVSGYVIGVVVPVKQNGKIIGILKANVNIIGALSSVVEHYDAIGHGSLKVVRTKGKVVFSSGSVPLSTSVTPDILNQLKNIKTGSSLTKTDNQENITAYAPVRLSLDSAEAIFGGKAKTIDLSQGNDGEIWHTVIDYDKQTALQESRETNKIIIYVGLIGTFIAAFAAFFIGRFISKPIGELSEVFQTAAEGNYKIRAEVVSQNEIGKLASSFNHMLDQLNKTMASRDELRLEIEKRKEAETELKKQEDIMIAQSRQAAMGEMISMLAHQWRQPISAISMGANNILADIELDSVEEDALKIGANDILNKTQELSRIIDDFRDFFKEEKSTTEITAAEVVDETISVIGKSLENSGIKVIQDIRSKTKINTYSKELMQVMMNIIKNSKEAIVNTGAEIKEIRISAYDRDNSLVIKVCDSGGGIEDNIISKIYEPYFTTKGVKSGVGLGLYMSKTIVERHLSGELVFVSGDDGACFEVVLPMEAEELIL